jgi:hypothetical protein
MRGFAIVIVLALLSIECHAQSAPTTGQCDQVRAGIAQHGLQAARKHAMGHYGLTRADLRRIEQTCGIGHRGRLRPSERNRRPGFRSR